MAIGATVAGKRVIGEKVIEETVIETMAVGKMEIGQTAVGKMAICISGRLGIEHICATENRYAIGCVAKPALQQGCGLTNL